jgi:hypothetical protein
VLRCIIVFISVPEVFDHNSIAHEPSATWGWDYLLESRQSPVAVECHSSHRKAFGPETGGFLHLYIRRFLKFRLFQVAGPI